MALKRSNIERLVIDLTVPLPSLNGELIIGYYPAEIRGDVRRRLRDRPTDFLADVLAHWDLLQDDDTPVPIGTDTLKNLPWVLLWPLWHAITSDYVDRFPNEAAASSRGPSMGAVIRDFLDDVDWGEDSDA